MKLLERIENLRANFETCEQGALFWKKTEPLWNRMAQCLEEKIPSIFDIKSVTKTREDEGTKQDGLMSNKDGLMQKIMLNGIT